ncbi:hypothetical protein RvY_03432 [Ramazzottius varieornatus]|uniref:Uncharacterized protein n=1 Tax=Ramazzottius varieornatus TaxID=947166 RepID=A0A1D1UN32_RAMVA|nr:hypothetical protein RvY_03432 [Ramazzottius varieornatus]
MARELFDLEYCIVQEFTAYTALHCTSGTTEQNKHLRIVNQQSMLTPGEKPGTSSGFTCGKKGSKIPQGTERSLGLYKDTLATSQDGTVNLSMAPADDSVRDSMTVTGTEN